MDWLNYHHLRYFWTVAREGSLRGASEKLRVSQPSISAQIHALQESVGESLFRRAGRNLALTEAGELVFGYADEIFSLGEELVSAVKGMPAKRGLKLNVGIADSVPKLVAKEILRPVLDPAAQVHLVCKEGSVEDLLAQLATLRLDIVLADEPASTSLKFKTFNHLLAASGVSFWAAPPLSRTLAKNFPQSLDGAPALLPTQNTNLRRSLEKWFHDLGVKPRILGEFQDTAMLAVVAGDGLGFIPMPALLRHKALGPYQLKFIGTTQKCESQFYAITAERRITHPSITAITQNAQRALKL